MQRTPAKVAGLWHRRWVGNNTYWYLPSWPPSAARSPAPRSPTPTSARSPSRDSSCVGAARRHHRLALGRLFLAGCPSVPEQSGYDLTPAEPASGPPAQRRRVVQWFARARRPVDPSCHRGLLVRRSHLGLPRLLPGLHPGERLDGREVARRGGHDPGTGHEPVQPHDPPAHHSATCCVARRSASSASPCPDAAVSRPAVLSLIRCCNAPSFRGVSGPPRAAISRFRPTLRASCSDPRPVVFSSSWPQPRRFRVLLLGCRLIPSPVFPSGRFFRSTVSSPMPAPRCGPL